MSKLWGSILSTSIQELLTLSRLKLMKLPPRSGGIADYELKAIKKALADV